MTAAPSSFEPVGRKAGAMADEVRTILWLQRRLLVNSLRRGQRRGIVHVVGLVLVAALTLPYVVGASVGLAIYLRLATPEAALSLLAVGATFALLAWLASPASSQQVLEAPNLPRLLHLPLSLGGLVAGGLVASGLSLASLFTIPLLVAVAVGGARGPASAVALLLTGVAVLAMLVSVRTVIGDLFDLAAEDRRTRGRLTLVVIVPLMAFYLATIGLQDIGRSDVGPFENALAHADRLLWLPTGWFATGAVAAMTGRWSAWAASLAGMALVAAVGLMGHLRLQERLYLGDLVRSGPAGAVATGASRDRGALPGLSRQDSATLRALVGIEWRNLRRSPMTPRLAFVPLMFAIMTFFVTRNLEAPSVLAAVGAGGVSAFSVTSLAVNGLAVLDHRGLGALLVSPARRSLVLLAHGTVYLVLAVAIGTLLGAVVALATRDPIAVLVAPVVAGATQLAMSGIAHVSSVLFPYYVDLERGRSSANETSLLVAMLLMFGAPLVVAPAYALAIGTWFLAPALVAPAAVVAIAYCAAVYLALLALAARLFGRREERLLSEIVEGR